MSVSDCNHEECILTKCTSYRCNNIPCEQSIAFHFGYCFTCFKRNFTEIECEYCDTKLGYAQYLGKDTDLICANCYKKNQ